MINIWKRNFLKPLHVLIWIVWIVQKNSYERTHIHPKIFLDRKAITLPCGEMIQLKFVLIGYIKICQHILDSSFWMSWQFCGWLWQAIGSGSLRYLTVKLDGVDIFWSYLAKVILSSWEHKEHFLALAFPSYLKIFIKYGRNINRAVSRAVLQ